MAEQKVIEINIPVRWEPGDPNAWLLGGDWNTPVLALRPHPDDSDRRAVVFRWIGCHAYRREAWNDEGIQHHPLYRYGLQKIIWLGEVKPSDWLELYGSPTGLHHYIMPLKECVFEFLTESFLITRLPYDSGVAAVKAVDIHVV